MSSNQVISKVKCLLSLCRVLWCLRYFLQKDSSGFGAKFWIWFSNILSSLGSKIQNLEPLGFFFFPFFFFLMFVSFALGLWILKFYEMWNCLTRQKSYVRVVSALAVRTHIWIGSWTLTFASDIFGKAVHVPTERFCNQ